MNKILALDIGERRIGVAISDALGMLAHPLITLNWKNIKELRRDLSGIIAQNQITILVVGMPLTMKGTFSKRTGQVQQIVDGLKAGLPVEVVTVDERLTTKMAHDTLHQVGKKPSKMRDTVDQIAAVFILQSYLDSKSQTQGVE
jgi:putative Holliday junction resolvase